jgi:glycosyltransferase involved in cell wall biosynthesis
MIIEDARVTAPKLKFALVLHKGDTSQLCNVEGNFTVYVGIPDCDLLTLYQRATVMIQPLLDATANTAVLEAMACGLPIVLSDIGAVHDYIDDSCARFVPPFSPQAMLGHVCDLISNVAARRRMADNARTRACAHGWLTVSRQIRHFYSTV